MVAMDEKLTALADYIAASLPGVVRDSAISRGELALQVEAGSLLQVVGFLRDDAKCRFTMLCDLCGVDYPDRKRRFDVV